MRLKDRVAIVTGSGGGLGRTTALALSREGAKVVVSDIEGQYVEEVVTQVRNNGGVALGISCDVSKPAEVKEMVITSLNEFKRIDILVNNAGGSGGDTGNIFLGGLPQEVWERMLDVNLKGTIHCTMAVIPHMMERRYGKIINISSQAGRYASELAGLY